MVRYRKKLVSLPIRLRNQKWDTYHLSGTQLWLDRASSFAPNPCRKPPNPAWASRTSAYSDLVQCTLNGSAQRPSPAGAPCPPGGVRSAGGGGRWRRCGTGRLGGADGTSGSNQTIKIAKKSNNQIPLVIPPYHTTPKKNQNNQNTGSIPGNVPHCEIVDTNR